MKPQPMRGNQTKSSRDGRHRGSHFKSSSSMNSRTSQSHSKSPLRQPEDEGEDYLALVYHSSDSNSPPDSEPLSIQQNPSPKSFSSYIPANTTAERGLQSLIYHYNTNIVPSNLCVGPKRQLFPFALQHETLFHTIMYCSAAHLARLRGHDPPPQAVYHHTQALRLFNKRLAENPQGADLHALISSTCLMSALESFEGGPENCLVHWDGLSRLVEAAGGLHAISLHGNTRRNVLWADLAAAASLATHPRFDPYTSTHAVAPIPLTPYFGPPSRLTDAYAQTLGSKLYTLTGSVSLSQRAATVYWGLRNVSRMQSLRQMENYADTAALHEIQLSDRIEMLERIAVPLWCTDPLPQSFPSRSNASYSHQGGSNPSQDAAAAGGYYYPPMPSQSSAPREPPPRPDDTHHAIFRLFGFALLIHIYTGLRDMPMEMRIINTHAERILDEMERVGPATVDACCQALPELMIWVFMLGGKAYSDDDKRMGRTERGSEEGSSSGSSSGRGRRNGKAIFARKQP